MLLGVQGCSAGGNYQSSPWFWLASYLRAWLPTSWLEWQSLCNTDSVKTNSTTVLKISISNGHIKWNATIVFSLFYGNGMSSLTSYWVPSSRNMVNTWKGEHRRTKRDTQPACSEKGRVREEGSGKFLHQSCQEGTFEWNPKRPVGVIQVEKEGKGHSLQRR